MASSLALKSSAALRSFSATTATKGASASAPHAALPRFAGLQGGAKQVELAQGVSRGFFEVAAAQAAGQRPCSCAVQMVAATAAEPAVTRTYDFDTKVFKKERINLAGHEEVGADVFTPEACVYGCWQARRSMSIVISLRPAR